ncbi:hypothetical protein DMB91_00020 [Campylobacter sp. MIT 97-5078]|nr:hypothetical protein DMB91_00020 [Campylobacter sp. MIT 97-5078]
MGCPAGAVQNLMLQNNVGLVCYRTCGVNGLDNILIANTLIDLHLVGGGSNIFPLYNYSLNLRLENFTHEFRSFIDSKYNEHFSPEVILGYIYAVFFHKDYREKYIDFLKIDFPKILFVESKEKFLTLSALGQELIATHLMQDSTIDIPLSHKFDNIQSIGEALFKDDNDKNLQIIKPNYIAKDQKLFVNDSLHFCGVAKEVWEYKIGGYQVLDKYLKSHKGEEIDFEYFTKIIQTLSKSLEIEEEIARVGLV